MPSECGWLRREAAPPIDATARFLELYAQAPRPEARVLLVRGIFTRLYPAYLRRIRRALRADLIPLDAEGTLAENAAAIRDAVLREPAPVVLLGHSKGPLDIHAALALHPEIAPRVRAFVSVQAPFGGTPLATEPGRSPLLRRLAPGAFFQMAYPQRRAFLRAHPPLPPVPTVALATSCARAGLFLEKARRHLAEECGAESDGFVPTADAAIPGARLVTLRGLDHAALALSWLRPRAPYEAGRVACALVALALET